MAASLISGDRPVYGLSTGFGALADRYIEPAQRAALQVGLFTGREPPLELVRKIVKRVLSPVAIRSQEEEDRG